MARLPGVRRKGEVLFMSWKLKLYRCLSDKGNIIEKNQERRIGPLLLRNGGGRRK